MNRGVGVSEKPPKFFHSARRSNPGPLGCEPSSLPLHHRVPQVLSPRDSGQENFHKNRIHKKGGGVICYVKSNYPAVKIFKQESEKYDTVYIEVATGRHNKLTIETVYRPPKQQAADYATLNAEIQAITQNKQSVIIGDFNCPNIDWTTMNGDQDGNRLLEMIEDTFLTQIVTQPTRENNLLGLVLVSDSDLTREYRQRKTKWLRPPPYSPYNQNRPRAHRKQVQDSRLQEGQFKSRFELLTQTTWEPVNSTPVNCEWNGFKCKLLDVERTSVAMKTRTNNAISPPLITPQVRQAVNLKKRMYNFLKRNNTNEARDHYNQSFRACRNLIRQRKHDYVKRIAREAKSYPKMFSRT